MLRSAARRLLWMTKGAALFGGAVVTLALVFGVASMALGANGGNFILGKNNFATAFTQLVGNVNGNTLQLVNNNRGTDDSALSLNVQPGEAPMRVDSATRVANLNADKIDGRDANRLIRVASFNGRSPLPKGTDGTVATTSITAPASGFLVITAGSDVVDVSGSDAVGCLIEVDGAQAVGSDRTVELNGAEDVNQDEDCSTNTVVAVSAGKHKVDFEAVGVDQTSTIFTDTALSGLYVPFGANGSPPSLP